MLKILTDKDLLKFLSVFFVLISCNFDKFGFLQAINMTDEMN